MYAFPYPMERDGGGEGEVGLIEYPIQGEGFQGSDRSRLGGGVGAGKFWWGVCGESW